MPSDILEPNRFWSIDPVEPVKVRIGTEAMAAEQPITVLEVFRRAVDAHPDHPALVFKGPVAENWNTVTYSEYYDKVHHVAKAFIKLGLEPRHSVGIISFNCPEWFYSDLAAIFANGLAAGVYTTNSADTVCHILKNSRSNIVVVEDEKQLEKVQSIRDQLPLLKAIVQLNGPLSPGLTPKDGFYTWRDLEIMNVEDVEHELTLRMSQITPGHSASLIFTSGTVGMPKGVLLSHDNLTWNAKQIAMLQGYEMAKEVFVSYLPLSHIAGQFFDGFLAIQNAATVYFADKNALKGTLIDTLRMARPTRFFGVPRVFEKIHASLVHQTKQFSHIKRHLLNWAKYYSQQHHMNIIQGNPSKTWQYMWAKRTILNEFKLTLGLDRCETIMVGAAPSTLEVKQLFMSHDMPLMECYGMSEVGGPAVINERSAFRLDSVGRTFPGTIVKINHPDESGHGEIVMQGRHVFMGYIGDEEKTREALDGDGWLHSGDIGYADEKGFIYITGRIKELIITAGGENIPPTHVEELVKNQLACVSNAFLVGDHRKFLTMLITLKTEMDTNTGAPKDELNVETKAWLKELGLQYTKLTEVIAAGPCPTVVKAIEGGIVRANKKAISNAQKVQKFKILPQDFSVLTGELGPTLKLKRNVVVKKYASVIEEMYK